MSLMGDTPFNTFLAGLADQAGHPDAAAAYAGSYLAALTTGCPVIEGDTAHFLYQAPADSVVGVGGDWNGFDGRKGRLQPIGGGLLHYAHTFEPDARLDYYFYEVAAGQEDAWTAGTLPRAAIRAVLDPRNPRTGESGFGARSELAMPAYRRPAACRRPASPARR